MSCPICAAQAVTRYRPFCSKRCADIDLGKWMNGSYAVPEVESDPQELESALSQAAQDEQGAGPKKQH